MGSESARTSFFAVVVKHEDVLFVDRLVRFFVRLSVCLLVCVLADFLFIFFALLACLYDRSRSVGF